MSVVEKHKVSHRVLFLLPGINLAGLSCTERLSHLTHRSSGNLKSMQSVGKIYLEIGGLSQDVITSPLLQLRELKLKEVKVTQIRSGRF